MQLRLRWLTQLVVGLSTRRPGLDLKSIYAGQVDKVTLEQVFQSFFSSHLHVFKTDYMWILRAYSSFIQEN